MRIGSIGAGKIVRVFGGHEGLPKFAHERECKAPLSDGGALMDVGFREELSDFVAMTEGRSGLRVADGFAGLRSVEIAEAVRRSASTHSSVSLPALGRMPAAAGAAT